MKAAEQMELVSWVVDFDCSNGDEDVEFEKGVFS
jgi:hypothetical protein